MKASFKLFTLTIVLLLSLPLVMAQTDDDSSDAAGNSESRWGLDSAECVKNFSLFREFYRQRNYKDSYEPWQKVMNDCPQSSKNIYINGTVILNYQLRNTKDISRQERLVDTLMMVYDNRIAYFGEEGFVLGRKAIDYIRYVPDFYVKRAAAEKDQERLKLINDSIIQVWNKAYQMFERSISLEKNASSAPVVDGFFQTTEIYFKNNNSEKDIIIEAYDRASDILDFNINEQTDKLSSAIQEMEAMKKAHEEGTIDQTMLDNLIKKFEKDTAAIIRTLNGYTTVKSNIETRFTPYATCEDLVNIYGKKLQGNEENIELLTKVTRLMNRKKCIDNQVFFTATENLHRLQPTANSAFLMGYMLFKKEQFPQAKEYLEQAISKYEKQSDRAPAYIMLVEISSKMGQFSAARQYAYKYAEAVPTSGVPYLLIGDMYASTATSCGDNELTTRVAYWAAADKYNRAKQIDSSLEEEANQRISRVRSRFPDKNTIFFYGLQQGQSYTVGCWINETTTVR